MNNSDESNDEPEAKRPKTETEVSTSSKPNAKEPFLSLPQDILVKIIGYTSIAQWPSLELLDKNFRAATLIAWRQLRNIDLDREFIINKPVVDEDDEYVSPTNECVLSILQKFVEYSPFLTSWSGSDIQLNSTRAYSLLAKFEHLESISLGDAKFNKDRKIPLDNVVEFLETNRSRTSLKELKLFNVDSCRANNARLLRRFHSSFASGREIQSPLKLEKFTLTTLDHSLSIRLDNLDATRLTDVRVGRTWIEPNQLSNLIERASQLCRIELPFLYCDDEHACSGPRLPANKKLLAALASHEKLTAIKFDYLDDSQHRCMHFGPEFISMLETIGRRGQLKKLAVAQFFISAATSNMNMDEICATICQHIPYLQSLKLNVFKLKDESICNIVSFAELEEIYFTANSKMRITPSVVKKIAQLPHLKRLALDGYLDENTIWLKYLAVAPALMDLRIRYASLISADIYETWANGFASNLEVLMLFGISSERGLVRILKKATRLRVLILDGSITDQSLTAIAQSCPKLEILSVRSDWNEMTAGHFREVVDRYPQLQNVRMLSAFDEIAILHLQLVVDRCPRLKKLGGIKDEIRNQLQFPEYRNIGDVDKEFSRYDFDDEEYD